MEEDKRAEGLRKILDWAFSLFDPIMPVVHQIWDAYWNATGTMWGLVGCVVAFCVLLPAFGIAIGKFIWELAETVFAPLSLIFWLFIGGVISWYTIPHICPKCTWETPTFISKRL